MGREPEEEATGIVAYLTIGYSLGIKVKAQAQESRLSAIG
jgi:hypothetical protein